MVTFSTVSSQLPQSSADSFHANFSCSLRGRRRLPRANLSSYHQLLYIKRRYQYFFAVVEQGYLYFCASLDTVHILPLSLCIASTYVCYAYLWYEFIVLVSNNMQKLFYCDLYCYEVCFMHFLCICCCVLQRAHCNPIHIQYTLLLAINRLVHPSSTPLLLLQPLPHHLYCRMMCHNILCISCVHFMSSNIIDSTRHPTQQNHTRCK